MLTSIRGLSAASLSVGLLFAAAPAFAEEATPESSADEAVVLDTASLLDTASVRAAQPVDEARASNIAEDSEISFSANVAMASEYRFRGVNLTDGELAIQGGFDLSHSSGLYVGTWASNLDEQTVGFGSTELDIYGGWSGDLTDGLSADVGAIAYIYPDAGPGEFDYYEFYGSLSGSIGPASLTGGVAYAYGQEGLDFGGTQRDNPMPWLPFNAATTKHTSRPALNASARRKRSFTQSAPQHVTIAHDRRHSFSLQTAPASAASQRA